TLSSASSPGLAALDDRLRASILRVRPTEILAIRRVASPLFDFRLWIQIAVDVSRAIAHDPIVTVERNNFTTHPIPPHPSRQKSLSHNSLRSTHILRSRRRSCRTLRSYAARRCCFLKP